MYGHRPRVGTMWAGPLDGPSPPPHSPQPRAPCVVLTQKLTRQGGIATTVRQQRPCPLRRRRRAPPCFTCSSCPSSPPRAAASPPKCACTPPSCSWLSLPGAGGWTRRAGRWPAMGPPEAAPTGPAHTLGLKSWSPTQRGCLRRPSPARPPPPAAPHRSASARRLAQFPRSDATVTGEWGLAPVQACRGGLDDTASECTGWRAHPSRAGLGPPPSLQARAPAAPRPAPPPRPWMLWTP